VTTTVSNNTRTVVVPIEWAEPPPAAIGRSGGPLKFADFADALRANPGRWAVLSRGIKSSGLAGSVAHANLAAFRPKGSFEGVSRKAADGKGFDIYVRYVGIADDES